MKISGYKCIRNRHMENLVQKNEWEIQWTTCEFIIVINHLVEASSSSGNEYECFFVNKPNKIEVNKRKRDLSANNNNL